MRRALWAVYGVMWAGGAISGGVAPQARWAAPLFLLLAGLLAMNEHRAGLKILAGAALLGLGFEFLGVHTGLPFGRYVYTGVLAPAVFGVPLAIAFAWLILIDFVRGITGSPLPGALMMAAIDLVIDPMAAGPLRYWQWLDRGPYYGIPWLNFAGWILASLVILAALPPSSRRTAWVGWSVVAFFAVLALEARLWLPGLIGCAIVAATAFQSRVRPAILLNR